MWNLYWEEKMLPVDDKQKLLDAVERLNFEYEHKEPIFVQVENQNGDRMCVGIGNGEGYSFIDFFPADNSYSKHVQGENCGEGTVCFAMGKEESEFYIHETITYHTALQVLKTFLGDDKLDDSVEWIDD